MVDVSDVLPGFRLEAEELMTDTVTWTRPGVVTGPIVIDPSTGLPTEPADVVVFSGPARFFLARIPAKIEGGMAAGDYVVGMATYASIPCASPNVLVADTGTVIASVEHPQDIGLQYKVVGLIRNTQATAQRFQVQAVVG